MTYKLLEKFPVGTKLYDKERKLFYLSSLENGIILISSILSKSGTYDINKDGEYLKSVSSPTRISSRTNILNEKALLGQYKIKVANRKEEHGYYYDNCSEAGYPWGGCDDEGINYSAGHYGRIVEQSLSNNVSNKMINSFFTNNILSLKLNNQQDFLNYNLFKIDNIDTNLVCNNKNDGYEIRVSECEGEGYERGCFDERYYKDRFSFTNIEATNNKGEKRVLKAKDNYYGNGIIALPLNSIYVDESNNQIIDYGDIFISNIQARPMKNRPCKITWDYEVEQNPPYVNTLGNFELYASINGQPYKLMGQPKTNSFELLIDQSWNTIKFKIRGRNNVGYWGTFVESKTITTLDVILNQIEAKINGEWKTGLLTHVKSNGVWHPTSYYMIKKNGKWIERKL